MKTTLKESKFLRSQAKLLGLDLKKVPKKLKPLMPNLLRTQWDESLVKVSKIPNLSELEYLFLARFFINVGQLEFVDKIIELAKEKHAFNSTEFYLLQNKKLLMKEVLLLGHGLFPIYVWFENRWKNPRLPSKPNLKSWYVGKCTDLDAKTILLILGHQIEGRTQISRAETNRNPGKRH